MSSDAATPTPVMSEEQVATVADGVEICYQTFGDPGGRPLLLIMGLGGPMTWWPVDLCRRLAAAGFFAIRYDNRDTGRSTRFTQHPVPQRDIVRAFLGRRVAVPYSLRDMAADGVGLLDHLGLDAAHVAGVSMGGMIAQTLAIDHPDRVRSLTSIMSNTGRRTSGYQHPVLLRHVLRRQVTTLEEYVEAALVFSKVIGSPAYPTEEAVARARAEETFARGLSYSGVNRQTLAILTQRDRTQALGRLTIPVAVVHGKKDRMVHASGGRATARAVPGAELIEVPGMGHDLPEGLFDLLVDAVTRTADRAPA